MWAVASVISAPCCSYSLQPILQLQGECLATVAKFKRDAQHFCVAVVILGSGRVGDGVEEKTKRQ